MFTRKALDNYIQSFVNDLKQAGYSPERVMLFGSYAKGNPHSLSDIDLAVWDEKFTGCGTEDITPIASIVSKYPFIELHSFPKNETADENPFLEEIFKSGIEKTLTVKS